MPATKKKLPPVEPEPEPVSEIPAERCALAKAIKRWQQAEAALREHQGAISRARRALWQGGEDEAPKKKAKGATGWEEEEDEWAMESDADTRIEQLRERIAAADMSDVKTAATLLARGKPPVGRWRGDDARRMLRMAEERQELTRKALAHLEDQTVEFQEAVASAFNVVLVERSRLIAPHIEAALVEARDARERLAVACARYTALLSDVEPKFPPGDEVFMVRLKAREAREAVLHSWRDRAAKFNANGFDEAQRQAEREAADQWKAALDDLLVNPCRELPPT